MKITQYSIYHITSYTYDRAVSFGEHALMMRPRDSHDLRMIEGALAINPAHRLRWTHDIFANSVARVEFLEPADRLDVESTLKIEHFGQMEPDFSSLHKDALRLPFDYDPDDVADLGRCALPHYGDPDGLVKSWALGFLEKSPNKDTAETLLAMNDAIRRMFAYRPRNAHGTQTPLETMALGSGTCRDYALFFMEAVRSLGLGARFVSGYLYDPALDRMVHGNPQTGLQGAGATHAWVQVYLPGSGWIEFDPTNGLAGGANLIRVAVARDPLQASPVTGSYFGPAEAFRELSVSVKVQRM